MLVHAKKNKNKNKHTLRKTIYIIIALLIVAAVIGGIVWASKKPVTTASAYTKGDQSIPTTDTNSSTKTTTNKSTTSSGSSTTASLPLTTPTGDFVSDHHPNLSGSPAPNTMSSVCSTTPGATCYITFTQGSDVISLPKKTTDSGGGAYWDYTLQSVGLTTGNWQITAIATLNGQTQTATDAMELTVSE